MSRFTAPLLVTPMDDGKSYLQLRRRPEYDRIFLEAMEVLTVGKLKRPGRRRWRPARSRRRHRRLLDNPGCRRH